MEHSKAREIAEKWMGYLSSGCTRIAIAGSVRRGKPEVKDIELVAVPLINHEPDLFGNDGEQVNVLEILLQGMFRGNAYLAAVKNGPRYKQLALHEGIHLDLFIVLPPAEWGVQYLIRTGPADFSHWCVTSKHAGGGLPSDLKVRDGAIWRRGTKLETPEEIDVFRVLGLEYIEPGKRAAHWRDSYAVSPKKE